MTAERGSTDRDARTVLRWALGVPLALAALLVAVLAVAAVQWRDGLVAGERVLPGTVVAGTDLGLRAAAEVQAVTTEASEAALDATVTVVHGDRRWEVPARDLAAGTDAEDVLAQAVEASASTSVLRAAAARWLGRGLAFERDVQVVADERRVDALVEELAGEIDTEPADATVGWEGGEVVVRAHERGARLDRGAAAAGIVTALGDGASRVELEVTRPHPPVPADRLERWLPAVREAVDAALDRTITIRHDDRTWEVTPRELGAVPDPQPVVEQLASTRPAATAVRDPAPGGLGTGVPLEVPDARIGELLDHVAHEVERAPQDAVIDHSTGWVELHDDVPGVAVDRRVALRRLGEAVRGGTGQVELPVTLTEADRTSGDYRHVLLVRQDERRLYLYEEGEIVREWPVAVGAPGSVTPTGTFTVGTKRHLPVWYNPAPEGWGADMPEVVEPGPSNPLGVRALNWKRDGRSTLIRFHGTADVASIGRAASRGCVRLTNAGVVELYDLVDTGTTVVSLRG